MFSLLACTIRLKRLLLFQSIKYLLINELHASIRVLIEINRHVINSCHSFCVNEITISISIKSILLFLFYYLQIRSCLLFLLIQINKMSIGFLQPELLLLAIFLCSYCAHEVYPHIEPHDDARGRVYFFYYVVILRWYLEQDFV